MQLHVARASDYTVGKRKRKSGERERGGEGEKKGTERRNVLKTVLANKRSHFIDVTADAAQVAIY